MNVSGPPLEGSLEERLREFIRRFLYAGKGSTGGPLGNRFLDHIIGREGALWKDGAQRVESTPDHPRAPSLVDGILASWEEGEPLSVSVLRLGLSDEASCCLEACLIDQARGALIYNRSSEVLNNPVSSKPSLIYYLTSLSNYYHGQ